ncbi:Pol protein [Phytophthora palmivora]|uniref:Pol protein n=1 Tax=Phytophthora palmivora TaxID=4796 RepID=A0A2P4XBR7_9STRA|nr:Pol protein [Phytophthora palmivora]
MRQQERYREFRQPEPAQGRYHRMGSAVQSSICCYGYGKLRHVQHACPAGGQKKFPSKPKRLRGQWQKPRPNSQENWGHQRQYDGGVPLRTPRADNQVSHSESETPLARPIEDQYRIFYGVSGHQAKAGTIHLEALPEVSALPNLEGTVHEGLPGQVEAGDITGMVLLKTETSSEYLKSSSLIDEDVLEGFMKQHVTHLGSEVLTNPKDPEFSDVVLKHLPSQLPPDRGVGHEIDLVPGTKYCVTRQLPLLHE